MPRWHFCFSGRWISESIPVDRRFAPAPCVGSRVDMQVVGGALTLLLSCLPHVKIMSIYNLCLLRWRLKNWQEWMRLKEPNSNTKLVISPRCCITSEFELPLELWQPFRLLPRGECFGKAHGAAINVSALATFRLSNENAPEMVKASSRCRKVTKKRKIYIYIHYMYMYVYILDFILIKLNPCGGTGYLKRFAMSNYMRRRNLDESWTTIDFIATQTWSQPTNSNWYASNGKGLKTKESTSHYHLYL